MLLVSHAVPKHPIKAHQDRLFHKLRSKPIRACNVNSYLEINLRGLVRSYCFRPIHQTRGCMLQAPQTMSSSRRAGFPCDTAHSLMSVDGRQFCMNSSWPGFVPERSKGCATTKLDRDLPVQLLVRFLSRYPQEKSWQTPQDALESPFIFV